MILGHIGTPAAANPSRRMRQLSYLPQARSPLNVSAAEIDEALAILERAMAAVARHQLRMRLFPESYVGFDETSAGMRSPATSMLKPPADGFGALAVST